MDKRKGRGALSTPSPPDPQNKATDSVILQFRSFSSLSPTRCQDCTGARGKVSGQAGVPE